MNPGWTDRRNPLRRTINPTDGPAYSFEKQAHYKILAFLMIAGAIFFVLPNYWFVGQSTANLFQALGFFFPKLSIEGQFLNSIDEGRGYKHVLLSLFCFFTVLLYFLLIARPTLHKMLSLNGTKLTYFHSVNIFATLTVLILFFYMAFLNTGFVTSDSRMSREIGQTQLVWFWTPLLWGELFEFCQLGYAVYFKLTRFGYHLDKK
jgi:hypothetical protein